MNFKIIIPLIAFSCFAVFGLSADTTEDLTDEQISEMVCRAISEKLELEVELFDHDGRRWTEVIAPYGVGMNCWGREVLVFARHGHPSGHNVVGCCRIVPAQMYDSDGNHIGIGEMGSLDIRRVRIIGIREEWHFRPVNNAYDGLRERICRPYCEMD